MDLTNDFKTKDNFFLTQLSLDAKVVLYCTALYCTSLNFSLRKKKSKPFVIIENSF